MLTGKSMAMASLLGLTGLHTMVNGHITKCMGQGFSNGLMVESTKGSTSMTKSMVLVCLSGQMVEGTKETGRMESS